MLAVELPVRAQLHVLVRFLATVGDLAGGRTGGRVDFAGRAWEMVTRK